MKKQTRQQGFTLVELMIVVFIVGLIAAIALPSYQHFARRANAAQAQQELQKIAEQLERFKTRNFSYRGFNANYLYGTSARFNLANQAVTLPLDTSSTAKYAITIVDSETGNPLLNSSTSTGQGWALKAASTDVKNFDYLLTSSGMKCKKQGTIAGYENCGLGEEAW